MPGKKRFLRDLDISFISLVDKAANLKTVVFKSADPHNNSYSKLVNIAKVNEDLREVTGVVYEPDSPDSDGDYTTAEEIKKAEYRFMRNRNTNNVDRQHDLVADEGFVAESWIVQENDPRLPDAKAGSWAVVIKVENDETWEKIKSGEITGLSMGGAAIAQTMVDDSGDKSFFEKVAKVVKDGVANLRKDFNSQWTQDNLRRMAWALSDAIGEILNDGDLTDKKNEILKNVEQFRQAVEGYSFGDDNVSVSKNKNRDVDMSNEEIKQIVRDTVAEEVQPLIDNAIKAIGEKIEGIKGETDAKADKIEKRLEKVENVSPASAQDSVEVFKSSKEYRGINWLS